MVQLSTRPAFSGVTLKRIACISMFLDHLGASLLEAGALLNAPVPDARLLQLDFVLRRFGRIAFPIYCFLLVEGFLHTHDVSRYAQRLVLFALLSEIPFDLAFFRTAFYPGHQNVYWTLALGIAALCWLRRNEQDGTVSFSGLLGCVFLAVLAECLHTDYGAIGVLLIGFLYLLRRDRAAQCFAGGLLVSYELPAPLAFAATYFYNGERGRCGKVQQWVFYWFYPVHLAVLAAAVYILF